MASTKTLYICQTCEHTSPKWVGKCPECNEWNQFVEEVISKSSKTERTQRNLKVPTSTPLFQTPENLKRHQTGIGEFDRVLGGGLVPGSLTILSGEPGIGKSTLTLQLCDALANQSKQVLYISGEESVHQIAGRAKRLTIANKNLSLLNENNLEITLASLTQEKPDIAIIDSIQVIGSEEVNGIPGGITQVRHNTEKLMEWAKKTHTPLIIISHVNKEGNLAGPKTLEHLVDTVLTLEGDRNHDLRLLRGSKNRFGATNEVGFFEMKENGLIEMPNPSEVFIKNRPQNTIGSCLTVTLEGSRPLIVEVQALTNKTHFGYPKRATSGFDLNRLQILIAVLQKHANIDLSNQDVYVNIVGGIKLKDPAVDLAICKAIVSSLKKTPIAKNEVYFGEVGLAGEIRRVTQWENRSKAAKKLHLVPAQNNLALPQAL